MLDSSVILHLNTSDEEIRRKRRNRRKRVAAAFVAAIMTTMAYVYCRKRSRQIADIDEEHERNIRAKIDTNEDTGSSASTFMSPSCDDEDPVFLMIAEKLDSFATVLKDHASQDPKVPKPEEILAALKDMPCLDDDAFLDAYDVLNSSAHKFKSFLALPMRLRKRWLLKQVKQ